MSRENLKSENEIFSKRRKSFLDTFTLREAIKEREDVEDVPRPLSPFEGDGRGGGTS